MNSFLHWWQHLPQNIDPVILQIGGFRLQYYGLMYIVAFALTYILAVHRLKHEPGRQWGVSRDDLQGLLTAIILGLIVGARIGYVVFYQPGYYLNHPLEIVLPFRFGNGIEFTGISGMSYHGGLIGTLLASAWFISKHKLNFRKMADLLVPCIPAGYTFGRLGNFINGELWGRVTQAQIGMYFPGAGNALRHPSQLYEAFGEGVVLFLLLWALRKKIQTSGAMLALYLLGYGCVRFVIEYFREPDDHLGFIWLSFSMGQLLCGVMMVAGVIFLFRFRQLDR